MIPIISSMPLFSFEMRAFCFQVVKNKKLC
uniref:Uncharacterized protein n=1 Tax=virus sp. ctLpa4 TaxID=2825814 RepID=A0A8S5RMF0_9VIRU|nr:MAG TPA: hypothetical protein [virus sp. ctLpa4]